MYRRYIAILLLLFVSATSVAADYSTYHLNIARAEKQIFLDSQITEGLKTYKSVFKQFDFVFLHDCMNAIQIALYAGDEKAFLAFVEKSFQNGLTPQHFEFRGMKYIHAHSVYRKNKEAIENSFKGNRNHYLKRIDTTALKKMISLYASDQLVKNSLPQETDRQYRIRYTPQIKSTMSELLQLINEKGFPLDKLIGVNQNAILNELGIARSDLKDYYTKYKNDKSYKLGSFELDEYTLSSSLIFPIIVHYVNTLANQSGNKKRYIYHSDDFYMRQIKAGNIHPKDIAFFYDDPFRYEADTSKPIVEKGEKFFDVGLGKLNSRRQRIKDEEIDAFRKKFFIVPIEIDRAKLAFVKKNGMFIGWGFWGCRS